MIDTDKYEGHAREEWHRDSNDLWFHRNGKDIQIADILIRGDGDERYYEDVANARLITDAPLFLAELKRLRKDRDLLWDAIRLSGTGGHQEEEIAFWHEKLLNMNEAELKEAFKGHYEDD